MEKFLNPNLARDQIEEIDELLNEFLSTHSGALGVVIISYDGIIMAGCMPTDVDMNVIASVFQEVYQRSEEFLATIGIAELPKQIFLVDQSYGVISNYGGGLVIVFYKQASFDFAY